MHARRSERSTAGPGRASASSTASAEAGRVPVGLPMAAVKLRRIALPLVAVAALLLGTSERASAVIVERIVAVIGERPVLWTELVRRSAATRIQIRLQTHDANVVAVQEQEMYKE